MLKNTAINRNIIKTIAIALNELNEKVVYVGGAVVSLYVNNPAAEDVRPTKDLDISMQIVSLIQLESIRESLVKKGFRQTAEDNIVCRFRYDDIKVDVMSTKAIGWAPANPWFAPGFKKSESVVVEDQQIKILPISYFLASKFAAFNDRGVRDPRTSHDFEDIVYILDNRLDIVDQLQKSTKDVKKYLTDNLQKILDDRVMQEAVYGNLFYETRNDRYQRIIESIKRLIR